MTLQWDDGDIQSVGRLGYIDRVARFEYDNDFLTAGLEISPVYHRAGIAPGLIRPYDATVFDGLHGVFHDSLPDGWGRSLVDRRARELGIDPATLSTSSTGSPGSATGALEPLCYAPDANAWNEGESALDLDRLATDVRTGCSQGTCRMSLPSSDTSAGLPAGRGPKSWLPSTGTTAQSMDRHLLAATISTIW